MKLRNKKTGELVRVEFLSNWQTDDGTEIGFRECNTNIVYSYNSLTELNAEWEDYTPQEPLIKDEKIRKAIRAWGYSPLTFKQHRRKGYCQFWYLDKYICFRAEFEGLKDRKLYTITELCGEEE